VAVDGSVNAVMDVAVDAAVNVRVVGVLDASPPSLTRVSVNGKASGFDPGSHKFPAGPAPVNHNPRSNHGKNE
jgi:hypothetical protein